MKMKKTRKKYGFKQYIQKSLPLATTKLVLDEHILSKGSTVYYENNRFNNINNNVYGELVEITNGRVYCYWEREPGGGYTSWGWMPFNAVFKEVETNGAMEGVPIITLDWDISLGEKPEIEHET